MKHKIKPLIVWVVILVLALLIFQQLKSRGELPSEDFGTFLEQLESDEVERAHVDGNHLTVTLKGGDRSYVTSGAVDHELVKKLAQHGALVTFEEAGSGTPFWLFLVLPLLLVFLVAFFVSIKRQQSSVGNVFTLGKSRARLVTENGVTFADVGGADEAKQQLGDVIDFLRNPDRWTGAGVRLPRGVLLVGPPGCGKTLLARAVAGEAGVPFFTVAASEFVELFVGVGAARVRDMFDQAKKNAPAVIFIDELDAVGRRRGSGIGSAHDEREQTLNQLLASLDGFESNDSVVVVAATNRPDVLDKALLRPGRFDLRVKQDVPGREERVEILRIHTRNKNLAPDVSLEEIAGATDGLTGADLENLANEAGLRAVRRVRLEKESSACITSADLERATRLATSRELLFNKLDSVLIESASQLSQPTGDVVVRLAMRDTSVIEGQLVWADGNFLKVCRGAEETPIIVPKAQVMRAEALPGTETVSEGDLVRDGWAGGMPELM